MSGPYNIDYLLEEIITLPSLPSTLARIIELVREPDCSLSEVSKAMSADPAIALKTLRLANSASYGLRQRVSSIDNAVTLLGLKVIKNLVFTATVFDTLSRGASCLLNHSLACGLAMRVLAESGRVGVEPEEAFAYGLLHDVGKLILEEFMPKEFLQVSEAVKAGGVPAHEVENEFIGADHAEIGARLAALWKLPEVFVYAMEGHHKLSRCLDDESRRLAAALSVADYVCTESGFCSQPGVVAQVCPEAWEILDLQCSRIPPVLKSFFRAVPEMKELMEMVS